MYDKQSSHTKGQHVIISVHIHPVSSLIILKRLFDMLLDPKNHIISHQVVIFFTKLFLSMLEWGQGIGDRLNVYAMVQPSEWMGNNVEEPFSWYQYAHVCVSFNHFETSRKTWMMKKLVITGECDDAKPRVSLKILFPFFLSFTHFYSSFSTIFCVRLFIILHKMNDVRAKCVNSGNIASLFSSILLSLAEWPKVYLSILKMAPVKPTNAKADSQWWD